MLGSCRGLLYQPTQTPERFAFAGAAAAWSEATLSAGETDLRGLVRMPQHTDAPWILHFGGNATAISGSQRILERLRDGEDFGLAVFAYRGYDGSEGSPTQRALTADGVAAAKMLEEELGVKPDRIVIVGQSLGAGVSAQVARILQEEGRTPAGLVLVSPFESVPKVARDHVWCALPCLFPDKWRTKRIAPELRMPVLVLHGTRDSVIPVEHGRAIAGAVPGARYVEVPGRDHNDMWTPGVAAAVREFVREHVR